MNILIDYNLSQLSKYLQSHQEKSSLSLKITLSKYQNLPFLKLIEEELRQLTQLTNLSLHISKQSVLTEEGYHILSNAVLNLNQLEKLSIKIDQSCFLQNEGLSILQEMVNHLPQLVYLKLQIGVNNQIAAESAQEFLDSLIANAKLTTLNLHFEEIQSPTSNEGNIHFWRGLENLNNLEKLVLKFNHNNYGYSDLIELFEHIANLKMLKKLSLIFIQSFLETGRLLDDLLRSIRQLVELKSLKIDCNIIGFSQSFSEEQRHSIIRNLSNLKFLEKLKFNELEKHLFDEWYEDYTNLLGNLKFLKTISLVIPSKNKQSENAQILQLGQGILQFQNLVHFDFSLNQEDNNLWRQFFLDLSASFRQMQNLLSLNLIFNSRISEKGWNSLGGFFTHLQQLEKLKLKILTEGNWTGMLQSIRNLSRLKEFDLEIKCHEEEELIVGTTRVLLQSIHKLNQLQKLCLKINSSNYTQCEGIQNFEEFCNALMSLRDLESLECSLYIKNLESQEQLDLLKRSFQNLTKLNELILSLSIEEKSDELQDISLIDHLTNLKRLEIKFKYNFLNIFGSSMNRSLLEWCKLTFQLKMKAPQLIEILESLSQSPIKYLSLTLALIGDFYEYQEQFGQVCFKFRSIEKLSVETRGQNQLMMYVEGIKQMKSLKSLGLVSSSNELSTEDTLKFYKTLKQLIQLQNLKIYLTNGIIKGDERNIINFDSLKSLGNLRHLKVMLEFQVQQSSVESSNLNEENAILEDEYFCRDIDMRQICSLDLQSQNISNDNKVGLCETNQSELIMPYMQKENQSLIDLSKLPFENQSQNEENKELLAVSDKFNPTEMDIQIEIAGREFQKFNLNGLDFLHNQYLTKLNCQFGLSAGTPVELEFLQPLRDLNSSSKLKTLNLKLGALIFNEEHISYLSRNIQHLVNLQSLRLMISCFQDYYYLLFDSFSHLINLRLFSIRTNISENGAVSLGKSLQFMRKLEKCQLFFNQLSTFGQEGFSSILTGLKHKIKLKELLLTTDKKISSSQENEINLSESIYSLTFLQELKLTLGNDQIKSDCFKQFIISIGSLESLQSLSLTVKEANPFNQDLLTELIQAINKLKVLRSFYFLIYCENSKQIILGQEFATLFNSLPNNQLAITTQPDGVQIQQGHSCILLKFETMENLEVNFLEQLSESKEVLLDFKEYTIIKNIKSPCNMRKLTLKFINYKNDGGENIDNVCCFIQRIKNIFELEIEAHFGTYKENNQDNLTKLTSSLTSLNTLKILNLQLQRGIDLFSYQDLILTLNILKNLKYLQTLYLKSTERSINKQIIPNIQKEIIRLVTLNKQTQIFEIQQNN